MSGVLLRPGGARPPDDPLRGPPGNPGLPGTPGDDGRGIADISRDGYDMLVVFTDGTQKRIADAFGRNGAPGKKGDATKGDRGEPGKSIKGDPGEPGRGVARSYKRGDDLVLEYTDGTLDVVGPCVGEPGPPGASIKGDPGQSIKGDPGDEGPPGPPGTSIKGDPGSTGRGIADVEINESGELVVQFTDGAVKTLRRVVGQSVKGDPGPPGKPGEPGTAGKDAEVKGGYQPPKGRVLYGKSGRLTADRLPPSATNTLNIPDGFARSVTLLISDGVNHGMAVHGLHRRSGDVTTWDEWRRDGDAPVLIYADRENGGLAVEATQPGNWTCRMIGSPE